MRSSSRRKVPEIPDLMQAAELHSVSAPLTRRLNASLVLDAVGGPLPGQLLSAAPDRTTTLSYGRLPDWMQNRNTLRVPGDIRRIRRILSTDMQTDVRKRLPLERVNDALREHQEEMTAGKILLVPAGSPRYEEADEGPPTLAPVPPASS